MKRMLIVDDDVHLRALVKTYAQLDDFQCSEAENGSQAVAAVEKDSFDIIVLDVMMPEMDGFETLAELRKTSEVPVIMLTARKEEYDKLLGFNLGADDYLAKPFSPKELMARIKAILRRNNGTKEDVLQFDGLEIKEQSRVVLIDGEELVLTPKEFELLLFLAKNNNIVVDRDRILQNVWGYDYFGDTRTVDTHIKTLRERIGSYRKLITTIWGVGYRFGYKKED